MGDGFILSVDCGTQSIRAMIIDKNGHIVEGEKVPFEPYFSKKPGWAEQDPEVYWKSLCKATNTIKERNPDSLDSVIGVVVTALRDTAVPMDKDGNVLRNTITWLDQRMASYENNFKLIDKISFGLVGMTRAVSISRRQSKSNWIKEFEPEIWKKTYKYVFISGYLNYKLTGKFIDSVACQIGHFPFNYKKRMWEPSPSSWRWYAFGIEKDKLTDIAEPGQKLGEISDIASKELGIKSGIPVIAGGSDKGCETLGNGCISPDSASLSFGTTATIQITTPKYSEPIRFFPSYPAVIPDCYNPEVQIFRGYWMISWFKKEFAQKELIESQKLGISPEELLNKRLSEIPPGSHGLILQPYWGPHIKTPDAKGSIIGFGDVHTRIHIYRAIIEGINYGLMDGLDCIEKKSGVKVNRIMIAGGGSQSDAICQITADMFNKPVIKTDTYELSSIGAAIIGFVGLGVHKDFKEAISKMVHYEKTFTPDAENAKIYADLYKNVYKKIYPRLKKLYAEIKDITGYPDF